jgi:DNA-binding NarL/FixJ family response regulator
MIKKGAFFGKKILLISNDGNVLESVQRSVEPNGAVFYHGGEPKTALGLGLTKNPDLVIYDDQMPTFNGNKILSILRRARPKVRVLLLVKAGVPLRSIDVTAQGASFTITRSSTVEQVYNAVKHCLGIASVPRVEELAAS